MRRSKLSSREPERLKYFAEERIKNLFDILSSSGDNQLSLQSHHKNLFSLPNVTTCPSG
jgi:hypothetical protein